MREAGGWLEIPVQDERIEISTVGPDDGAKLLVHKDLCARSSYELHHLILRRQLGRRGNALVERSA